MCPNGWKLDVDWKTCVEERKDDDDSTSPEEETSVDMMEETAAHCQPGLEYDTYAETCVDIDECHADR